MTDLFASSSKRAQMKIQQMAFMLVAVMIFFALVGLIYFAISLSNVQQKAGELAEKEAKEIVRKLSGSPELAFTASSDCSSCIDLDKAILLTRQEEYKNFWNLDYLMIEKISPVMSSAECTISNYPDCGKITIIDKSGGSLATKTAFVSLARWDPTTNNFVYELGRIHASARELGS